MRQLSLNFMNDLKNDDGLLNSILKRVKLDHTLMLAIRDKYINIYYRGGNILEIKENTRGGYKSFFNLDYNISNIPAPNLPHEIKCQGDAVKWIEALPYLKEIMDIYFSKHPKAEREFQQLVARENNYSTISNDSEYFISDIEFADPDLNARFDLLAIRWLASHRRSGNNCRAALIEMKYGDAALGGKAGLIKHLKDIDALFSNHKYKDLLETMESQFNQLDELDLLNFNRSSNGSKVKLIEGDKPEVIFLFANHNPRSTQLLQILHDSEIVVYEQSPNFDLRFFVSNFAGYGLHANCMLTLSQFRNLLGNMGNP